MKLTEIVLEPKHGIITKHDDIEKFVELAKANCKKYLASRNEDNKLWRGTSNADLALHSVDTATLSRKSKDNYNFYTILLDNAPAFKDFPKRGKSLICSNSFSVAASFSEISEKLEEFKNVFEVFPYDDAKIAHGPTGDALTFTLTTYGHAMTFGRLDLLLSRLCGDTMKDLELLQSAIRKGRVVRDEFKRMFDCTDEDADNYLEHFLTKVFTPEGLRIKEGINHNKASRSIEHWVEGKVLMLPSNMKNKFEEAYQEST